MPTLRSGALERWWPSTQSLDLVLGAPEDVGNAVLAELTRIHHGEHLVASWENYANLSSLFSECKEFTNVPTYFTVLPTHSKWSVLWNNSFLCDGYDSLCWCLTKHHRLTTMHFSAHDQATTFQPGAAFTYRSSENGVVRERTVCATRTDKRWDFVQAGTPLPEEDYASYGAAPAHDRLNEGSLVALVSRLGAAPWQESFYAVGPRPAFVIRRPVPPREVVKRAARDVLSVA